MNHPPDHGRAAALLLRGAADRITRHGLYQGGFWPRTEPHGHYYGDRYYQPGDPSCVLGALALAAGVEVREEADAELDAHPGLVRAVYALADAVHDRHPTTLGGLVTSAGIARWNDETGRHAHEVTGALHAAADQLDPLTTAGPGGSSAKTSHQATGSHRNNSTEPNHQDDSKETNHV